MTFDELKSRLSELDETRRTAERELETLSNRSQRVAELEADRDALLAQLVDTAPTALDALTPEGRHHFYKVLGLRVFTFPDNPPEVEVGEGFGVRDLGIAQGRCSG